MVMATAMQTASLSRPTSCYIVTTSRSRCLGSGCGQGRTEADQGGAEQAHLSSHHRKRDTKTQAIRFVAEEGARNEYVRCGGSEVDYMVRQAEKPFSTLADVDNSIFASEKVRGVDEVISWLYCWGTCVKSVIR